MKVKKQMLHVVYCSFICCILLAFIYPTYTVFGSHTIGVKQNVTSEYVWEAEKKPNKMYVWHKNDRSTKKIVYCYNQNKKFPEKGVLYKKITIHNDTRDILYHRIQNYLPTAKEETIEKIVRIIINGYPANPHLQEHFAYDPEVLWNGTQYAIWSVIHGYDLEQGELQGEIDGTKEVGMYLLQNDNSEENYNIQISFFEPENTDYQCLLALEYIVDPEKEQQEIVVEKFWGGVSNEQVKECPEIKVAIKYLDRVMTYLNLNSSNRWKASYIAETEVGEEPIYSVAEIDSKGNEVTSGSEITLGEKKYLVDITKEEQVEGKNQVTFKIVNTQNEPPKIIEKEELSYEVTFSKVEVDKVEELEGAILQIVSGEAIEVEPFYTWTSTKQMKKVCLKEGIYTMIEKEAPKGYEIATPIVFRVLSSGGIEIKENNEWHIATNSMVRMEDKRQEALIEQEEPKKEEEEKKEEPKEEKEEKKEELKEEKEEPKKEEEKKKEEPKKKEEKKKEEPKKEEEKKKEEPKEEQEEKKEEPKIEPKAVQEELKAQSQLNIPKKKATDPVQLSYLMGLKGRRGQNDEEENKEMNLKVEGRSLGFLELEMKNNKNINKKLNLQGKKMDNTNNVEVVKTYDDKRLELLIGANIVSCIIMITYIYLRKKADNNVKNYQL